MESAFGTVEVMRTGYSGRGLENLYPLDAELDRRPSATPTPCAAAPPNSRAAQSFDAVVARLRRDTAARVPKRQVAQLLTRAATDFGAFYQHRPRLSAFTVPLLHNTVFLRFRADDSFPRQISDDLTAE